MTERRDWLDMNPGHFDTSLLPRTRRAPRGQFELFTVADVAPPSAPAAQAAPQLDGQLDLFS